ncbi:MAG TPA: phosphatase PAP2 family protein [Candidatus Krumholzibacteria bacterium]|nr:phosphatase PAP2 family protein [Candidatus Krumholzibacteria bacterium]HRX51276.1 phosphatase PAP2 family protein [Candidatus Krumholzibacteria bacterium]
MNRFLSRLSLTRLDLDRWAVVYLVASGLYPLLNPSVCAHPWWRLALHLGLALVIWFVPPLLRRRPEAWLRVIGEIYLPFAFPMFYAEMEWLGIVFHGFHDSFDPWFIDLEYRLFGLQPSLEWSRAMPWPWFHELMEFQYFTYYFYAPVTLILLWRGREVPRAMRWPAVRAFIRDLSAIMLLCYSLYTFFPAWGPKFFRTGPIPVGGWIFTDIMHAIHANGALLGAAFPSSHVAGSMAGWWHVWKWFPRHRAWVTPMWVMLCMSTVYCRYHYVVDVIAGLLLGALVLWLGGRFGEMRTVRPWQRFRRRAGDAA